MAKHTRQGPDVVHDPIRGRWYSSAKAQQRAFRDEVEADPEVQRGVTLRVPVDFDSGPGRLQHGRKTARLQFDGGDE